LVFGTLHSNTASKTIDRIIDVFPAAEKEMVRAMLSSSIQGIIAQTLLPKEGGGRVAAHEIMVGTNAIRNLIRENQLAQIYSMIQTGSRYGMQTMEDSVNDLVVGGFVSEQTAHEALKSGAEDTDEQANSVTGSGAQHAAPPPQKKSPLLGGLKKAPPPVAAPPKPAQPAAAPPPGGTDGGEDDGGYSF
jgi:twitching motility protein PilT